MAQAAITRLYSLSWRRHLALVVAVASLSLSLANRQFHWLAQDGISVQAYSTKVINQRFACHGPYCALPPTLAIVCLSPAAPLVVPELTLFFPPEPHNSLYSRPPPTS